MGFHTRHIDENILKTAFNTSGSEGVLKLFKADAIVTCDKLSSNISDLVYDFYYHKDESRLKLDIKQKMESCF